MTTSTGPASQRMVPLRSFSWFVLGLVTMFVAALAVSTTWRADAAPGDDDTTFVPVQPCRLMDTRPAPLRIGPHATFGVDDTNVVEAHGDQGECVGIPTDASGLALNVTAVGATQPTFLTIWPEGDRPLTSSLNPAPDQPPTPNAVTTLLTADGRFRVYNLAGAVDVIVDVTGYYTASSLLELDSRLADLEQEQAGVVFAGGDLVLDSIGPDAYPVRWVAIDPPSQGYMVATASGYIEFTTAGVDAVECSISGASAVIADAYGFWADDIGIPASRQLVPFSTTRSLYATGNLTTVYLMCAERNGEVTIHDPQISVIWVPESYYPAP